MASPAAQERANGNRDVSSSSLQSFVLSGETVVVEGLSEGERITKHPGEIKGYV